MMLVVMVWFESLMVHHKENLWKKLKLLWRQVFCYNQAMNSINIEWGSKILGMENYIGKKIAATHIPLIINPDSGFLYFDEKGIVFTTTLGDPTIKIDYCDMSEVLRKRALLGIISCFCILTRQGENYKFIVFKRAAVVEFLKSKTSGLGMRG